MGVQTGSRTLNLDPAFGHIRLMEPVFCLEANSERQIVLGDSVSRRTARVADRFEL